MGDWADSGATTVKRSGIGCHHCSQFGHWKVSCFYGLLCFVCRRPGHGARSCPRRVEVIVNLSPERTKASGGRGFSYAKAIAGGLNHTRLPTSDERGEGMVVRVSLSRETIAGLVPGKRMVLYF